MSNKKEEKGQAAADRIKAAALSAAKGLSRAQAERAAAAAARNVNAYGQKEEGPSRWQERKEAKRQMYLLSTEKAVKLGERKDLKQPLSSTANAAAQCQKCYQTGHWTYECKNERVYISRPSRTQQLKNPKLMVKLSVSYELDNPDIIPEETVKDKVEKISKNKSKRKHRGGGSESGSDSSEASVFETESENSSVTESDSSDGSSSDYSSSDSEDERRRRKRQQKRRKHRKRYASSESESSESDSGSESESEDTRRSKRKGKRHGKKH